MEFTEATLPEVMAACSVVEDFKHHLTKRANMWAEMFHADSPFDEQYSYTPVEISPWDFPDTLSPMIGMKYRYSDYDRYYPDVVIVEIPREFLLGEEVDVAVMYFEGLRLKRLTKK